MSPQLYTLLVASLPIIEIRGAMPLALQVFNFSIPEALFWSVLGNMLPVPLLLWLFDPISKLVIQLLPFTKKYFEKLFEKTRGKFIKSHEAWGVLALIIFVGIPIPGTGAWTGALAAWIFGYNKFRSFIYLFIGVIIAGIAMAALTKGVDNLLNYANWY